MTQTLLERAYERSKTLYPEIVLGTYRLSDLPVGGIIGTWTYSIPGRLRVIFAPDKQLAPGVMPGDIARLWLRETYHFPIRRRSDQRRRYILPIFSRPGRYPDVSYVDIKSAYKTVLLVCGYAIDYRLSGYLIGKPTELPPEIAENKLCYALLVAMSASPTSQIKRLTATGVKSIEVKNIYANVCLYALVSELLASVAREIINTVPVFYVNTDGYIVPTKYADVAIRAISRWGFKARVKVQGPGEVLGTGSWSISNVRTVRQERTANTARSAMPTRKERKWLKLIWTKHVDRAKIKIRLD